MIPMQKTKCASRAQMLVFLWGGKTHSALIATPNEDNANRRQKKGKS
jgi:hypothetical protein